MLGLYILSIFKKNNNFKHFYHQKIFSVHLAAPSQDHETLSDLIYRQLHIVSIHSNVNDQYLHNTTERGQREAGICYTAVYLHHTNTMMQTFGFLSQWNIPLLFSVCARIHMICAVPDSLGVCERVWV